MGIEELILDECVVILKNKSVRKVVKIVILVIRKNIRVSYLVGSKVGFFIFFILIKSMNRWMRIFCKVNLVFEVECVLKFILRV